LTDFISIYGGKSMFLSSHVRKVLSLETKVRVRSSLWHSKNCLFAKQQIQPKDSVSAIFLWHLYVKVTAGDTCAGKGQATSVSSQH